MNQVKIGAFIAECRKQQGLTQVALAQKLGITDRAVSKWERGKSMPDSGIMLDLCQILGISVNELLSGERIMSDTYNKKAEENLLAMKQEIENKNAQMLKIEYLIATPSTVLFLVLCLVVPFLPIEEWIRIFLVVFGLVMFIMVACVAVGIEQKAGYYECQSCFHRYVPTYSQTLCAPHFGRTRYMKCPECNVKSWQKKKLTLKD